MAISACVIIFVGYCAMNLPNELNSRLRGYLQGNSSLEEFRVWFADVLRSVNRYEQTAQKLVWAVDCAVASFVAGDVSREQFHQELELVLKSGDDPRPPQISSSGIDAYTLNIGQVVVGTGLDIRPSMNYVLPPHPAMVFLLEAGNGNSPLLPVVEMSNVPPAWVVSKFSDLTIV